MLSTVLGDGLSIATGSRVTAKWAVDSDVMKK